MAKYTRKFPVRVTAELGQRTRHAARDLDGGISHAVRSLLYLWVADRLNIDNLVPVRRLDSAQLGTALALAGTAPRLPARPRAERLVFRGAYVRIKPSMLAGGQGTLVSAQTRALIAPPEQNKEDILDARVDPELLARARDKARPYTGGLQAVMRALLIVWLETDLDLSLAPGDMPAPA